MKKAIIILSLFSSLAFADKNTVFNGTAITFNVQDGASVVVQDASLAGTKGFQQDQEYIDVSGSGNKIESTTSFQNGFDTFQTWGNAAWINGNELEVFVKDASDTKGLYLPCTDVGGLAAMPLAELLPPTNVEETVMIRKVAQGYACQTNISSASSIHPISGTGVLPF